MQNNQISLEPSTSEVDHLSEDQQDQNSKAIQDHLRSSPASIDKFTTSFYLKTFAFSIICTIIILEMMIQFTPVNSDIIPSKISAPAKRTVIFYTDGTKPDSLFGFFPNGTAKAPFIRDLVLNKGSFGISYTGLPTESRICATMMLSGHLLELKEITDLYFLEQTKSDHIFNQSKWAFGFGMREIIGLFEHPKEPSNVHFFPFRNFTNTGPTAETDNVMEQFMEFLDFAGKNEDMANMLFSKQVVILLHLVSVDTSGHNFGGSSAEYMDQISYADKMIKKAVERIDEFFKDDKTAFIITSDHGMRDIKLHTGNYDANIQTPFVAWGAGIKSPEKEKIPGESHDDFSKPWKFDIKRKDIRQIDIPAMVASLIGVPFPLNSEGLIPIDYLTIDEKSKSEELFRNAKQICSLYENREQIWKQKSLLSGIFNSKLLNCKEDLLMIEHKITGEKYKEAQDFSTKLIKECENVIHELKQKEKDGLLILMIFALLGWVIYCFESLVQFTSFSSVVNKRMPALVWYLMVGLGLAYLFMKSSPIHHYFYLIFPLYLSYNFFLYSNHTLVRHFNLKGVVWAVIYICFIYLIYISFDRKKDVLALTFVIWSLMTAVQYRKEKSLMMAWAVLIAALAYMLRLDVVEVKNTNVVLAGSLIIGISSLLLRKKYQEANKSLLAIGVINILCGFWVFAYEMMTKDWPQNPEKEARLLQILKVMKFFSSLAIPFSFYYPFYFKQNHKYSSRSLRILICFTAMASFYTIESIDYEALFYFFFGALLLLWIDSEKKVEVSNANKISNTVRLFVGYQVLFQLAYFGFGNPPTFDTFNLDVNYRFLIHFSSVKMGVLMLLKNSIPFFMLSAAFQTILIKKFRSIPPLLLNLVALVGPGLSILGLLTPGPLDFKHPKLYISYPIVCCFMLFLNIIMARVAHFMTRDE